MKPSRCHMVIHVPDTKESTKAIAINVDLAHPNIWKTEPYYSEFKRRALEGLELKYGFMFNLVVYVGTKTFVILPNKYVDVSGKAAWIILPVGPNKWEVMSYDTKERARKAGEALQGIKNMLHALTG